MPRWMIKLDGRSADLDVLASLDFSTEYRIVCEGEGYFLISTEFELFDEAGEVWERGEGLLERINNAAKFDIANFEAVNPDLIVELDQNGLCRMVTNVGTYGTPVIKDDNGIDIILVFDEQVELVLSDTTKKTITATVQFDRVAQALGIFHGSTPLSFAELFNIYEIIEDDVEGQDKLISKGWIAGGRVKLFTHTANTVGQRHYEGKFEPPLEPMSLEEANELIRTLLEKWIAEK